MRARSCADWLGPAGRPGLLPARRRSAVLTTGRDPAGGFRLPGAALFTTRMDVARRVTFLSIRLGRTGGRPLPVSAEVEGLSARAALDDASLALRTRESTFAEPFEARDSSVRAWPAEVRALFAFFALVEARAFFTRAEPFELPDFFLGPCRLVPLMRPPSAFRTEWASTAPARRSGAVLAQA